MKTPTIPGVNSPNNFINMQIFHDHFSATPVSLLNVILVVLGFRCPQTSLLNSFHSNIFLDAYSFWSFLPFHFLRLPLSSEELLRAGNLLLEEKEDAKGGKREQGRRNYNYDVSAHLAECFGHPATVRKNTERRYANLSFSTTMLCWDYLNFHETAHKDPGTWENGR